jgi:hypothetical protein
LWVKLRQVVETNPDYNPCLPLRTVDIDGCPAEHITLEIEYEWDQTPSLIIHGSPTKRRLSKVEEAEEYEKIPF